MFGTTPLDLLNALLCRRWDWEKGPVRHLVADEVDMDAIDAAIAGAVYLTDRNREALRARYLKGLTFREIGKRMYCTPGGARDLVARALNRLRRPHNLRRFHSACPGWFNVHR
jgi:DNA-directed RNA polymerase specialized sigma24 family protein